MDDKSAWYEEDLGRGLALVSSAVETAHCKDVTNAGNKPAHPVLQILPHIPRPGVVFGRRPKEQPITRDFFDIPLDVESNRGPAERHIDSAARGTTLVDFPIAVSVDAVA